MKNKWSSLLIKNKISKFILDEIEEETKLNLCELKRKVENKKDIQSLKKAIKVFKNDLTKEVHQELLDELKEIEEDHSWGESTRGQYIIELNDWKEKFHQELKELNKFHGLLVGGHSEKEIVYISGKLAADENIEEFLSFIQAKNPPRKIVVKLINY
ncbi:MAG: hypothetical protein NE330_22080 [Lentisphaeraceae bacterium]|nr:hypothetical protein [Lentisphaeraceae bacterium]